MTNKRTQKPAAIKPLDGNPMDIDRGEDPRAKLVKQITLGFTLMGMAAAGHPADALTDAHIHYLSIYQFPDGSWKTTSYRPPEEYGRSS